MTWVDGVIILGAVIGAAVGYRQGLILSIFAFLGFIAGVFLAGVASDALAEKLSSDAASWACIVLFIVILIIVMVIFNVAGNAIKNSIKTIMLSWADSAGGALLGLFMGGLMMSAVFIAIGNWAAADAGETSVGKAIGNSVLARFFIDTFRFLLALLPGSFDSVRDLFD
jgi:uncharacterized membrane protein required for colicin V production